jgi:hypothetical protein
MRKIEKALDKLLELDEVLLHFEVKDPYLWINIAFKYLKEADSAEEIYNEEVWKTSYITDNEFNYNGAFLHINPHLMIDTHHFCMRAIVGDDKKEVKRKIPDSLKETVIALDKIAQKAYNENQNKV